MIYIFNKIEPNFVTFPIEYDAPKGDDYKIEIKSIRQIGSPTTINPGTGTGGDNPDDNVDNYLSVKIHITPWAVRNQSVDL